ncbi:hypothetical protein H072_7563 [Dactylellina haptotyla CBS 200.50]|uniref:Uncharacterized protein n=1 Tax=Dactylellina haptotyla (strain CBS 200.50) TaxID=1284197 RepID=S8BH91_DACHA|nr:hypothetical protein H072_7563 [Dactylellina haptotyla CBS 200.50]
MNPFLLFSIIFAIFAAAAGAAYSSGVLDPIIAEITKMLLKAKAEAEVKGLQAQGLKEGQDFLREDVPGNREAADIGEKFAPAQKIPSSDSLTTKISFPKLVPLFDGNSDTPFRKFLKPIIPPRTSSLHALCRSHSSENLNPLITIEEAPSRRASSLSLPSGASGASGASGESPEIVPEIQIETHERPPTPLPNVFGIRAVSSHTPKLIGPFSTPQVVPQTSLQPEFAMPVLVIPENDNPFDLATTLKDGRVRRLSTGNIDPSAEEEDETQAITMRNTAKNLLSTANYHQRTGQHVGWKTDFLTVTPEEGNGGGASEGYSRRRSSSLPDLPGATRPLKSVKGRRATPWVHNIGINGNTVSNSGAMKVKLAIPSLKRLSDASAKSVESECEIWYDSLEEQEHS